MKQIKQQTNNVNLDTLMLCNKDLVRCIKGKPDMLPYVMNYLNENQKYTLLEYFCILGESKNVQYLTSHGADIHINDEEPLRLAVKNGYLDVVKDLVFYGADIHINDEEPLRLAVENGHLDIVENIVSKGADIHVNNEEPLRRAIYKCYFEIAKYLHSKGADVNHLNFRNRNLVTKFLDIPSKHS